MDLERTQFLVLFTCSRPDCLYTGLRCDFPLLCFRSAGLVYYGQMSVFTCSYTKSRL